MWRATLMFALGLVCVGASAQAAPPEALLMVRSAPACGLVVARVDFTEALRSGLTTPVVPEGVRGTVNGQPVPLQFVPDRDFDGKTHIAGTVVLRWSGGAEGQVRVIFDEKSAQAPKTPAWDGTVALKQAVITHDAHKAGGLPSRILLESLGKAMESFVWNDRVYHAEQGAFFLRYDPKPKVEVVSQGSICTVVRVRAKYTQPDGKTPASEPEATYDWYYFRSQPLVFVTATARQNKATAWQEHHFLELIFPGEEFRQWGGGEPMQQGDLTASKETMDFADWSALRNGQNAVALLESGHTLIHDGRGGYGTYLHAYGDTAWQGWKEAERRFSAWLWIGTENDPIAAVQGARAQLPTRAKVTVTQPKVRAGVEKLRTTAMGTKGDPRHEALWRAALAERLEGRARFGEALEVCQGRAPAAQTRVRAGDLGLTLERTGGGVRLESLFDLAEERELQGAAPLPLFTLTLRRGPTGQEARLAADAGWRAVFIAQTAEGLEVQWKEPEDPRLKGLAVTARAALDRKSSAVRWTLRVAGDSPEWGVWRAEFPQLALAEPGGEGRLFVPRGPGAVQQGAWDRAFRYEGLYPNGWATMQFLAVYGPGSASGETAGLYVGVHDGRGSHKEILAQTRPADRSLAVVFRHPAPDMGRPGNGFELSGEAVWQLLRGDWFDAATIYRSWAWKEARWLTPRSADGRSDTVPWMRELCVWALGSGAAEKCVPVVKEFAKFMGVPVGFHWYDWHQIPFDNDYPHFFPPRPGFTEGVRELQAADVFVMPYINGRLWDTRDRGKDDFEFSRLGRPAAAKREDGGLYTETYSSKEEDGSTVSLAVMCPTTRTWQETVRGIVQKLFQEVGVKGVYIDQVAAAPPVLCFDAAHSHPAGGGHWWNEGYREMLEAARAAMAGERMLTSECNAEPFIGLFDGYLTWHWQEEGQVPAFPAVYGGAVQLFGRAYRAGATKDLALRMKAGQQLVFGEQIGWIEPGIIHERENAEFLRQIVRLRWQTRRYFSAGEMARPPQLVGKLPKVRADWQWSGEWWVTTDAVLAGAWKLPQEGKIILLFANVSDERVTTTVHFQGPRYGLDARQLRVTTLTESGKRETLTAPASFRRILVLPKRTALVWEISAAS